MSGAAIRPASRGAVGIMHGRCPFIFGQGLRVPEARLLRIRSKPGVMMPPRNSPVRKAHPPSWRFQHPPPGNLAVPSAMPRSAPPSGHFLAEADSHNNCGRRTGTRQRQPNSAPGAIEEQARQFSSRLCTRNVRNQDARRCSQRLPILRQQRRCLCAAPPLLTS